MRKLLAMGILTVLIAACARPGVLPTPAATLEVSAIQTQAAQDFIATLTAQAGEPSPIPTVTATPTLASGPTTHVVQPGDTLASIASQYGTTAEAVCLFNALPDCSAISPGQELLIPPEGFTVTIPTPSVTPTHTATSTPTPTPLPTDTPGATPTFTPTSTPTPEATFTATPTTAPAYEFIYEEGSMQTAPNCGTVYLKINVVGAGGEPVNGITVRLQWVDFTDHKITGPAGEAGFSPLGPESYHSTIDFHIQLVQSPSDPTPRSNEKIVHFTGCATAGQFTNIRFVYQW